MAFLPVWAPALKINASETSLSPYIHMEPGKQEC